MGTIKRSLEIEEYKHNVALSILVKAGAITVCDTCDDYVDNRDDVALKLAYKIANSMITNEDKQVEAFEGDRKALTDLINSVYADSNWECHCEQVMKD